MATAFTEFKKYIAPDVLPCPDPIVERELISTIIDFCKRTHVITRDWNVDISESTITTTTQDSMDIDLTDLYTSYRPVAVARLNIDGVEYEPQYKEIVNTLDAFDNDIKIEGVKFFWFKDDDTIRIYDMDDSDENLYIRIIVKPIRAITTVADEFIYEDHIETIAAGVRYRILGMPGKPWTSPTGAKQAYIDWRRGISKARANRDRGYTKNPQTVHPRSFG